MKLTLADLGVPLPPVDERPAPVAPEPVVVPLLRSGTPLVSVTELDPITEAAIKPFDLDASAPLEFYPWVIPETLPGSWGIGLIVGASGSGKSQLLTAFGELRAPEWQDGRSIVSHFANAEEAQEKLYAVGLNSVPVWRLPYVVLSTGQKFRADLARQLEPGGIVDEFTSVVDRNVAIAASKALSGYAKRNPGLRLVLASCHRDVIEWLQPDWTIDTDAGTFTIGQHKVDRRWWAEHIRGEGPVGKLVLA